MFCVCCTLLYVHSSIAIILMGKRELIALLNMSSWCLVIVEGLFLTVPRGCLQFVNLVFPDHTHLLFMQLEGALHRRNIVHFSRFTAQLTRCRKTKFPTVYPTIYPKMNILNTVIS